ncbi:MAG: hypothetical protein K0Q99_550 [Clostridia bacterium]|jgi:hypothetical protein|nr:hypothetical protein [Clostridia bacterium]
MDERKQYVPTTYHTYPAGNNKVGLEPEAIVNEAAAKHTEYKNTEDVPIESVAGNINFYKYHNGK